MHVGHNLRSFRATPPRSVPLYTCKYFKRLASSSFHLDPVVNTNLIFVLSLVKSDDNNTCVDHWIQMKGHKVFEKRYWSQIYVIEIFKDQNCSLFAEEDLHVCGGRIVTPGEDFVGTLEED